jgi:hypothetical protein
VLKDERPRVSALDHANPMHSACSSGCIHTHTPCDVLTRSEQKDKSARRVHPRPSFLQVRVVTCMYVRYAAAVVASSKSMLSTCSTVRVRLWQGRCVSVIACYTPWHRVFVAVVVVQVFR